MSHDPFSRRLPRSIAALALGGLLACAAAAVHAATATVAIGFDTDDNPGTGCTLTLGAASLPGIEVALHTVVTTTATTGTVGAVTRRTCAGGVFGAPVTVSAGGWAVGLGAGLDGSDLVETFIPLADLGGAGAAKIGAVTPGDSLLAASAMVLLDPQPAVRVPIPALSPPALLLLLFLVGGTGWLMRRYARQGGRVLLLVCVVAASLTTASALAIIFDGNGADWTGVAPLATDTAGDAPAGQDLVALYAVKDGANLALRVDLALARDPANQAPVANAGTNQTITLPATAMLSGSAADDGLPDPPATLTYAWAKFSGPGTVMFGNAASPTTSAGFSVDGNYVLRLTVSDSALAHSADVTITVNAAGAANLAPIVNAGANQAITLPAAATLAGTATDDGLPLLPGTLTIGWSLVSGPGAAVTFGNPAAPATTATFQAPGTYVLRLSASDGALSAASDVQITVSDGAPLLFTVADRTIALGTRYQQLLVAGDANVGDTLTYSLLSAPSGAALSPSPLVDWVPTAAQLGMNTFTARVTDAAGHSATTTFHVTVVHTNRPPQLAPQSNVILPVGTAFTRTLQATDPDAGDTLTFALVSGPMGMTRTGAVLDWNTAGKAPGDYPVSVNVTDAGGLADGKVFTVTLTPPPPPPAAPVANDDSYSVKVGQTLTVTPAGVLANDTDANGDALTANRLSDPAVGTLTTFNANGSFTYFAPAVVPGAPLTIAKMWNTGSGGSDRYHELVADLNGDGYPDVISFDNNGGIRARSGQNGNQLWSVNNAGATDCRLNSGGGSMDQRVLADLDDSGHPALAHTTTCTRSGGGWADHIVAYSHLGTVKWVSPPLSKPHPDVRHGATPVPPGGFTPGGLAWQRGLSVARLTAGGAPVLLMRVEIPHNDGYTYYVDAANQFHYAGCRAVTGLVADENVACRATLIISGTDGSVLDTLVVRNPAAVAHFGGPGALSEMPPIAMDIDGDGRVDLVSGTEVWMQNAGGGFDFAWQLNLGVNDTAVADLDGDGKAEIIHIRSSGQANFDDRGIFIYSHDGQLQRRIPLWTYWFTPLTIADVDGDGRPDIVLGGDGTVYAFRDDGRPIWAHKVPPDVPSDPVLAPFYVQPGPGSGVANAAPQVYDLDGDGVAEVVVAAYSRIIILDGRTGVPKTDPFWTFNFSYNDVSALILADMNNDGHVDIVQNAAFNFNCLNPGVAPACAGLVGPTALGGGGANSWLPGPKAWPNVQYRSTAIDDNARVLHDTTVSRIFRVPVQRGSVRDPRLAEGTSFTYAASDGTATSAPATVFIEIVPDNQPPVFTSVPPKSLWQRFGPTPPGGLVTHYYDLAAVDPDPGDTITFSLKSAPAWVTLSGPARIRFEPTCGSYGYPCPWGWTTVIVTATDSRGAATDQIFIVNLTTSSVTVPNVVGMALDAAQTALVAAELQGVQWVETFAAQPAGTVLAQEAVAGAVVGRFDDIKLTVSKGPQPALVPFVVGMTLTMANGQLAGLGFTAAVTPEFSTTIPVNQVMAQSPAAGTPLLPVPANPVALTVSSGPPLAGTVVQVVVEPGPTTRLAGEDQQYKATAVFADGTSTDVTLSSLWLSTVTSVATVNAFGAAHAVGAGATLLRATVAGVTGETTLNVVAGVTGDNVPPSASITAPANGSAVTASIQVTGTATDANFLRYELAVAAAGDAAWTLIGEGTSPVANGALATFDPTTLVNDLYTIRLTVFDRGGNQSEAPTTVQLPGQRKIGPFNLTFTDLKIPMAGVPITVNRTYDSRDKAQGDFGIGWRLGLQTLRLRSNRVLGTGWVRNVMGVSVTLAATDEHKVSLTLPDGRVEEFDMVVSPTANIGSLDATSVIGFIARSGTMGKLVALVNNDLLILGGGAEDELVDDSTLNTYDPQLYRYTGVDGVQIEIHKSEGVKKITDLDGNTLTIGAGGIVHSGGKSVLFTRDPQGRITRSPTRWARRRATPTTATATWSRTSTRSATRPATSMTATTG
ncbi:MAG: VCBS repeat-containing protein [Betaproteobacteria bacterium]|nr:VCBS repeat-containing protein [Betaproteobacteria bacterium]